MTMTKIRTTIATLAAAFTVALATAPVTPDAHARPNDGRYQDSSEAKRKEQQNLCDGLQVEYGIFKEGMETAKNKRQFSLFRRAADSRKREAYGAGCAWAH